MSKLSIIITILAGLVVVFLGYKLFNGFNMNSNSSETNGYVDSTAKDLVSPIMNNNSKQVDIDAQ